MKKVIYSVTKIGKKENTKITGSGYITDTDLITALIANNGKPYVRVFEDALKYCHNLINSTTEFKGVITEFQSVEFELENGSKEAREIEVTYLVWYKLAE